MANDLSARDQMTTFTYLNGLANEIATAPMRRAALGGDSNIDDADADAKGANDGTPPPHGGGGSCSADGAGTSSSTNTTPLGKRAEEGGKGGGAGEEGPEAPSPTKAHKGSM